MLCLQIHSPVDSATMSPVERTAAWVLNNGQYEEEEEDADQNQDEAKHAEKVVAACQLWVPNGSARRGKPLKFPSEVLSRC